MSGAGCEWRAWQGEWGGWRVGEVGRLGGVGRLGRVGGEEVGGRGEWTKVGRVRPRGERYFDFHPLSPVDS